MTKFCHKCGTQIIDENSVFCKNCGVRITESTSEMSVTKPSTIIKKESCPTPKQKINNKPLPLVIWLLLAIILFFSVLFVFEMLGYTSIVSKAPPTIQTHQIPQTCIGDCKILSL